VPKEACRRLAKTPLPSRDVLETFGGPSIFPGTFIRRQTGSMLVTSIGFSAGQVRLQRQNPSRKWCVVKPLEPNARVLLSRTHSRTILRKAGSQNHAKRRAYAISTPIFRRYPRSRRAQGRRHRLPPYWPLLPERSCAECEATRPFLIGPIALAPRRVSVSDAVVKRAAMSYQAST